jgi:ABC-type glycerol-3-phosphate transport system permease component
MGYVAASLVLATFCAKRMVSLRALAISSNVAFITYGLAAQLWPIVMLHVIMLPLNVSRLRDALASLGLPSCTGSGTAIGEPEKRAAL